MFQGWTMGRIYYCPLERVHVIAISYLFGKHDKIWIRVILSEYSQYYHEQVELVILKRYISIYYTTQLIYIHISNYQGGGW